MLTDTGPSSVAGDFRLVGGASASTTGGLSITGSGDVVLDPYYDNGGGSSLTIGGTLINSSASGGALLIGNGSIGTGDTVTAAGLVNTGVINIQGNDTIQLTLTSPAGQGSARLGWRPARSSSRPMR